MFKYFLQSKIIHSRLSNFVLAEIIFVSNIGMYHPNLIRIFAQLLKKKRMFISEKTIDAVVEALESADFEHEIEEFGKEQPALMGYVFSEDFDLLTQEERELMLYLMLVIWQSILRDGGEVEPVSKLALEDAEERNWELLDTVKENRFRERITVFFDDSDQEDLLAFVEDSLVDDDDSTVTQEGREPIFVALKSVIDILTKHEA
jgi:hypothetical protein